MKRLLGLIVASVIFAHGQHSYGAPPAGHGGGPPATMGGGMGRGAEPRDHGLQTGAAHGVAEKARPEQLLSQNSRLAGNLQKLLPANTTPQQACSGFSNLGRCVAAVHVAQNLHIPFSELKAKVTGSNAASLGAAIHDLKPDADAKREAKKAERQARDDVRGSQG